MGEGMITQVVVSNQRIVELIESNVQRPDENDKEHRGFMAFQLQFQEATTNMNSVSFGSLVASDPSRSFQQSDVVKGARTFTITARVNF